MPLQQLVVGIAGGRDLLVGDLNSSSDPFVQLTTLEPEWNETFKLGSRGFDLRAATSLRCLVLDFDGLKRDDVLGVLEVPLDLVACPMDDWYRIVKVPELMSCDAKGELHLAISQPAKSVAFQGEGEGEDASPNLLYVTIDSDFSVNWLLSWLLGCSKFGAPIRVRNRLVHDIATLSGGSGGE
ncbi:hypothetical protein PF007_g25453 [Phytophthora fragariae]|uniref:C2 domain-containing protein n=2 Tax=Phytophthora fragariae TaxID=53985 RepID=A0A6A3QEH4_9STRA|nr:hypothetical protein PF007_g25453 [Phytophthora fragariae]KAE9265951.1 hypothetical protein PF001_g30680 [Phytophthora fragariae]